MALTQNSDQRVFQLFAAVAASTLGEEFRPLAAQMPKGCARTVEPIRVNRFLATLPCEIGRRDLGADLGNGVVEFNRKHPPRAAVMQP